MLSQVVQLLAVPSYCTDVRVVSILNLISEYGPLNYNMSLHAYSYITVHTVILICIFEWPINERNIIRLWFKEEYWSNNH